MVVLTTNERSDVGHSNKLNLNLTELLGHGNETHVAKAEKKEFSVL